MNEKLTAFDNTYAGKYDKLSGDTKGYEVYAKTLTDRLLHHKPDVKEVLEIGSGTGNSALVLLESAPSIEHVFGVEANDLVWLANAKRRNTVDNFFSPGTAPTYSAETARRMQAYTDKFHLIQASGEALPLKKDSVDAVFMNQVFHWLDPDKALQEVHRVLKPDGIMVFDESEYQFDFGDSEEGRAIKREQMADHPFIVLFEKNLTQELESRGNVKAEPFKYLFTLDSLTALLAKHGFQILPDAEGNPYTITPVRYTIEQIMSVAENAAPMRIMRLLPSLSGNPVVYEIVATVMENTKQQWDKDPHEEHASYGSTQAAFVAQKN